MLFALKVRNLLVFYLCETFSRMQEKKEDLKVDVRVIVIDQFGREHKLLPQCFRYIQDGNFWNLELRAFTTWS